MSEKNMENETQKSRNIFQLVWDMAVDGLTSSHSDRELTPDKRAGKKSQPRKKKPLDGKKHADSTATIEGTVNEAAANEATAAKKRTPISRRAKSNSPSGTSGE